MIFPTHLLIYLSAHSVSLAYQRRGKFHFVGEYRNDETGYQACFRDLKQFSHVKLSILLDSVDEQYHAESLPHVIGAARSQMLTRRLRQVSRDSAYSAAWHQGREEEGRRDDSYLFVSLNSMEWVHPWFDMLALHHVKLALLTTVPMVSHALVLHLPQESAPLLWVTQQSGGTRLTFFIRNRLLFSRLTTPESSLEAEKLAEEIIKTRYYLISHQYLPPQSTLAVVVLDTQHDHQRLCQILNQDTGLDMSCQVRNTEVLAQKLWINPADLHRYRDSLHLVALGRYSAPVNLATPEMTLGYRQKQWQRGLYMTAVATALIAVFAGGFLSFQRDQMLATVMQTRTMLAQQKQRYQDIEHKMPAAPTAPINLKNAVEAAKTLQAAPEPLTDFSVVSDQLAGWPQIALTRLAWVNHDVDTQQTNARLLYVDGEIRPFQGDFISAMNDIDGFIANLRKNPEVVKVDIISMPVNRDPKATLHQATKEVTESAPFKLKLLLREAS